MIQGRPVRSKEWRDWVFSSKMLITQLSGQQRLCTGLRGRHSCDDGLQATIMTTVVMAELEKDMDSKCEGLSSSSTYRVRIAMETRMFMRGLPEKLNRERKTQHEWGGAILREKVLDWIKGRKWATQQHSSLSASDCTCDVSSYLMFLPPCLPGQDGRYPQTVSQNKLFHL